MAIMTMGMKPLTPMTACSGASGGNDQIPPRTRQLRRDYEGAARIVHALIINYKILTFKKATLAQYRAKRLIRNCCHRVVEGRAQEAQPNEPARLLAPRPNLIGSLPVVNTIGTVELVALAASAAGVVVAAMTVSFC
jgi:hypothetical protein